MQGASLLVGLAPGKVDRAKLIGREKQTDGVCIRTYMSMCKGACMYVYIYKYRNMFSYTDACACTCMYIRLYLCVHMCSSYVYIHTHELVYVSVYVATYNLALYLPRSVLIARNLVFGAVSSCGHLEGPILLLVDMGNCSHPRPVFKNVLRAIDI